MKFHGILSKFNSSSIPKHFSIGAPILALNRVAVGVFRILRPPLPEWHMFNECCIYEKPFTSSHFFQKSLSYRLHSFAFWFGMFWLSMDYRQLYQSLKKYAAVKRSRTGLHPGKWMYWMFWTALTKPLLRGKSIIITGKNCLLRELVVLLLEKKDITTPPC